MGLDPADIMTSPLQDSGSEDEPEDKSEHNRLEKGQEAEGEMDYLIDGAPEEV